MSDRIMHFTIGPVQGFVAQARRTRDFWAGSFLLSWLSGQAMAATLENTGAIEFPDVGTLDAPSDPLLAAILGKPLENRKPHIGSLPNRFKAVVPDQFDPALVKLHVQRKWSDLAAAVWNEVLSAVAGQGQNTKQIWDRQIQNFWDIQWVVGTGEYDQQKNELDGAWLDLRKNWRSHWPSEPEGGDHCTIMGDWQELSGHVRSVDRERQDTFWCALQEHKQNNTRLGRLEMRDGERLCAIALVKRLFPKLSATNLKETIGWTPGGSAAMLSNWPSTAYMSALPWLLHIANDKSGKLHSALNEYFKTVHKHTSVDNTFRKLTSERVTLIEGLESLREFTIDERHPDSLDGNLFLEDALANARATPLSDKLSVSKADGSRTDPDEAIRKELLGALGKCNGTINAKAPVFYALLLFDGDNIGTLLQLPKTEFKNSDISRVLSNFTRDVDPIVSQHSGVTMYAGGDDVVALLPITTAIACASAIRQAYGERSAELLAPDNAARMTGSAAIVFAHFHLPLRDVIREGHDQLDKVAKDGNGRNSLALSLFKPGGVTGRWVGNIEQMPDLFQAFQKLIAERKLTNSFFYNLRTRYPMLTRKQVVDSGLDAKSVLLAEYYKGRELKSPAEQAEEYVQTMLNACCYHRGEQDARPDATRGLQIGGAMIARFIVEYGVHLGRRQEL